MKIILNNRPEIFPEKDRLSVKELLKLKNFTFPMIIVKINGMLIRKDEYPVSFINEGDKVTVLHLISGG